MSKHESVADFFERARVAYGPHLRVLLEKLRSAMVGGGYACDEVEDLTCEDLEWTFTAYGCRALCDPMAQDVHFTASMRMSEDYGDPPRGVSFVLTVSTGAGRVLHEFAPYNFTKKCWVKRDDAEAVSARLRCLEEMDFLGTLQDLIAGA